MDMVCLTSCPQIKAVFHKFYLVHSWILCPKWSKKILIKSLITVNHGSVGQLNSFGILVIMRQVLQKLINATTGRVERIVLACVVLYNYLQQIDRNRYSPSGFKIARSQLGPLRKDSREKELTAVLYKISEYLFFFFKCFLDLLYCFVFLSFSGFFQCVRFSVLKID